MKPKKHMMEWTLVIMILACVGNLVVLYSSHMQKLSAISNIVFLVLLTFFAIASIQNALDAIKENKYLVPVCATGAFFATIILTFAVIYREFGLQAGNQPVSQASVSTSLLSRGRRPATAI
jgi:hypothetical protein